MMMMMIRRYDLVQFLTRQTLMNNLKEERVGLVASVCKPMVVVVVVVVVVEALAC